MRTKKTTLESLDALEDAVGSIDVAVGQPDKGQWDYRYWGLPPIKVATGNRNLEIRVSCSSAKDEDTKILHNIWTKIR